MKTLEQRMLGKINKGTGCWLWTGCHNGRGYGRIHNGQKVMDHAHRVAYSLWVGEIPAGHEVIHVCDNPRCVNPAHLRLGSHADNMADAGNKRRVPYEERHHWAKYPKWKAARVIFDLALGLSRAQIARALGVRYQFVHDIYRGKAWRHLREDMGLT